MLLVVDIGNSSIKAAVFDAGRIIKILTLDSDKNADKNSYSSEFLKKFRDSNIDECVIISVVEELNKTIKFACDKAFGIDSVILDTESSDKIKIDAKEPKSVGMDRLANVYAVMSCPLPAIVVDIGTAITFDILSENREFLGGLIMPGVNMSLNSLACGTSKLPKIAPKSSVAAIGKNTEECILSGVVRGSASAIDGLLRQSIGELGDCKTIILTGGQAELVSKYMEHSFDAIDKNLTLKGVEKMYRLSKKRTGV